jgi:preprotein translocase SecF subunit
MRLKLVPHETSIRFLSKRLPALVISMLLVIASLGLFAVNGVNKGIDFSGGILMEVGTPAPADVGAFRDIVSGLGLGDVAIQTFGTDHEFLIRIERQPADEAAGLSDAEAQQAAVEMVQGALDAVMEDLSYRRVEFVGPKVAGELVRDGTLAILFAVGAVLLYIWFRFEWHFGVGAIAALIHDVILTVGFFAITRLEFNLSIIAAILTIIGYSLNDTVVVYDRVRENLRKYQKMDLEELLDMSLNKTLSRTLMTSVTTLIALFALFFLGGEVIRGFTAAMIWGVFVGTYSSVFIASPALLYLNLRRTGFESESEGDGEQVTAD